MAVFTTLLMAVLYFLPAIYAYGNSKKHAEGIFVLNLFLGWTIIGWIGALIWASSDNKA